MKPFNIKLSEEHRAAFELQRKALGLKSEADVVRYWADNGLTVITAVAEPTFQEAVTAKIALDLMRGPLSPEQQALRKRAGEAYRDFASNMGVIGEGDSVTPLQPTPGTVARKGKAGDNAAKKTAAAGPVIVPGPARLLSPGRANPKPGKGTK